jgi:hypothetical protein
MLCAGPGDSLWQYLSALRDETAKRVRVLVVGLELLNAEPANFLFVKVSLTSPSATARPFLAVTVFAALISVLASERPLAFRPLNLSCGSFAFNMFLVRHGYLLAKS